MRAGSCLHGASVIPSCPQLPSPRGARWTGGDAAALARAGPAPWCRGRGLSRAPAVPGYWAREDPLPRCDGMGVPAEAPAARRAPAVAGPGQSQGTLCTGVVDHVPAWHGARVGVSSRRAAWGWLLSSGRRERVVGQPQPGAVSHQAGGAGGARASRQRHHESSAVTAAKGARVPPAPAAPVKVTALSGLPARQAGAVWLARAGMGTRPGVPRAGGWRRAMWLGRH